MVHGPEVKPHVAGDVTIRHVLCPVDLSGAAAKALTYAAALSSGLGTELTVLFVDPVATERPRDVESRELTAFIAATLGPATEVRPIQRQGEPIDEILRTSAALDCDLIVMGTHGHTGVQRLLLGSVAESVLRRSLMPVLVVPHAMAKREDLARLDSVICAVDFALNAQRVVEYAVSVTATTGARLVVAHVLEWSEESDSLPSPDAGGFPTSEDDAVARLNTLITSEMRARCSPELVVGYGSPGDELLCLAKERGADLMVLGVRRRNALDLVLFGSTVRRVLRDAPCPVLTVSTSG
jgi:nucleotide-binding universal stress UspA family protein